VSGAARALQGRRATPPRPRAGENRKIKRAGNKIGKEEEEEKNEMKMK
jgi:hypothetical protein